MMAWLTCLAGLCLLVAAARPPAPLVPSPESGVATTAPNAPADTLSRTVTAGDDLIVTLPADDGAASYSALRTPALSWLVDRSFLWRTRSVDTGTHTIMFTRGNAPADTLVMHINVTPSTP